MVHKDQVQVKKEEARPGFTLDITPDAAEGFSGQVVYEGVYIGPIIPPKRGSDATSPSDSQERSA